MCYEPCLSPLGHLFLVKSPASGSQRVWRSDVVAAAGAEHAIVHVAAPEPAGVAIVPAAAPDDDGRAQRAHMERQIARLQTSSRYNRGRARKSNAAAQRWKQKYDDKCKELVAFRRLSEFLIQTKGSKAKTRGKIQCSWRVHIGDQAKYGPHWLHCAV